MDDVQPGIEGVLETAIYCSPAERDEVERSYQELLGLRVVARWEDGTAFRVGLGVLLLFDREKLAGRDDPTADHGTSGRSHVCLVARRGDYEAWKRRLEASGVSMTHEHEWKPGLRSFYFRDPAGNLFEIAEDDLWPR